jgi:hypothetical protein
MLNEVDENLYSSLPLPAGTKSIRVLDVHPSRSGNISDPITSDLRVISLNDHVEFAALSYVWGVYAIDCHTISCNGLSVEVTANAYSALQHLRQALGKFTIWIDAICINQGDELEKCDQIPFMGEIFSTAKKVYFWLGEGNVVSDKAMNFLLTAGFVEYFSSCKSPAGSYISQSLQPLLAAASVWRSFLTLKETKFVVDGKCNPKVNFFNTVDESQHSTNTSFRAQFNPCCFKNV